MNITKLSNSHYRVRMMYDGKTYSKYYLYKPTQKEALRDLNDMIEKEVVCSDKFSKCIDVYINSKLNILSPTSIKRYKQYYRAIPSSFLNLKVNCIDKIKLQNLINNYSISHSPKTTKCFYGFIASVIRFYTDKQYKIILPAMIKHDLYIPTKDDVLKIIDKAKNTQFEIPILLASYGMRIGEIMALTLDDIRPGEITINKTIVYGENNIKIIKQPKTPESNRILKVPQYITDLIKQKKEIYNSSYSTINKFLTNTLKELNIPYFTIHKFRHFFATELHNRNIPSKYIQKMGGWATDRIMQTIYTHTNKEYDTINIFD